MRKSATISAQLRLPLVSTKPRSPACANARAGGRDMSAREDDIVCGWRGHTVLVEMILRPVAVVI